MRQPLDPDTAAAMTRKAMTMMSQRKIPLYWESYLVWFGHCLGISQDLDADIDRIVKEGRPFSEAVHLDLYARHFRNDALFTSAQEAQKEILKILRDVLGEILHTQDFTADYRDKLAGFTANLEGAEDLGDVHKVVSDLMQVTVSVIRASEQLKVHLAEMTCKSEKLQRDLEAARQETLIDPLTGLHNRKAFDRRVLEQLTVFKEEGAGFSLAMIDIDSFKKFNDQYGHLLGDQILKFLGCLLTREIKGKDFVARYGGEEFVILLPGTSLEKACLVAENIRKSLAAAQLKYVKTGQSLGKITISAGVSAVRAGDTEESLLKRADDAMYLAKQSGRNNSKSERHLCCSAERTERATPLIVEQKGR